MNSLLVTLLNLPVLARRLSALGITAALGLSIAVPIWIWISEIKKSSSLIYDKRMVLGNYQTAIDRYVPLAANQDNEIAPQLFLDGFDEGLLQANLQNRMNSYTQESGNTVQSIGPAPSFESNGVRYVGVSVSFSGPIAGIHNSLLAIESGMPMLTIRSSRFSSYNGNIVTQSKNEPVFGVQMTVYGAVDPQNEPDDIDQSGDRS